jgi:hypothetical protein
MRTCLKLFLLVGFATIEMSVAAPRVSAADLAVTRAKKVSVHTVHHRTLTVRDLDGTPIILRRARAAPLGNYVGALFVNSQYEAIPVSRPQPSYYLNGEPVLPQFPRSWPSSAATSLARL